MARVENLGLQFVALSGSNPTDGGVCELLAALEATALWVREVALKDGLAPIVDDLEARALQALRDGYLARRAKVGAPLTPGPVFHQAQPKGVS